MFRIDAEGTLWIPTSELKKFKDGEVKDIVFTDDITKKKKKYAICVEIEQSDTWRWMTNYKPIAVDNLELKIIQYMSL